MRLAACRLVLLPVSVSLWCVLACAAAWGAEKAGMMTRTFKVQPDFLTCEEPRPVTATTEPDTPTRWEVGMEPPRPVPARKVLEDAGISFPEGANASFDPVTAMLTVTNTPENMESTAGYMTLLQQLAPANVAFTVTVVEGPGSIIREADATATKSADAAPALAMLLEHTKQAGTEVHVVGDAFLETKSGTRATVEAVREHHFAARFQMDAKSQPSILSEMQQTGLTLEIEPTVNADRQTVSVTYSLALNPVPPAQRQVSVTEPFTGQMAAFPVTDTAGAQFTSTITIPADQTKMIGITKPAGTPREGTDTLWAVFLTCTLRPVAALPAPQVAARPRPATLPQGMAFAALPAPDGLFADALDGYPAVSLQAWFSRTHITFPPGASVQHENGLLHVINTPENISLIATVVQHMLGRGTKTVAFTLHTLEAPAALLRDLTRQTLATADDTAMLAAVEAAAAREEARFISSTFVEAKPGTRATHDAFWEHRHLSSFRTDDKGRPVTGFATGKVGSHLEVEPLVGADNHTVDITLSHEQHPTMPVLRRDSFRSPATQEAFELPVTDFHVHKTTTAITMSKGGTKLISLNAPTGREAPGLLWATFLKCEVVSQVSPQHHARGRHGSQKSLDPKAWNTRTFRVPPDFLSVSGPSDELPVDPFEAPTVGNKEQPRPRRLSAKEILEGYGVSFPEGATASFNPALSTLFVKNTNENLDLVEAFVTQLRGVMPKTLAFTIHVLQGPGSLLRRLTTQAAAKSNHRAELEELLAAMKTGTVQHLDTARIESSSGTRSTSQQGMKHSAITQVSVNEKGEPVILQETRCVGLQVDLEQTVGADGVTVELLLNPEFHTAPPLEHREHLIDTQGRRHEFPLTDYHTAKVTTGITLPDGTARLISLHKPTGKPEFEKDDILQMIFITCDTVSMRE